MQTLAVNSKQKKDFLRENSYFHDLSDQVLADLSQGTYLRRYQRGEIVCWQGEPCAGLFVIQDGSVKLFKLSTRGRELIIRVLEEGASFNEVPVFDRGNNPVNVATLQQSEIWMVDSTVTQRVLDEHPEMARAVISNLSANLRMLVSAVEELSFYQVTNRLARLISRLPPERLMGESNQRVTQDHLAAQLGTVREVLARSLRELERSGAIEVKKRQIQVVDQVALKEWAQEPEE
jgi:CRP-like cAMP-binding protein